MHEDRTDRDSTRFLETSRAPENRSRALAAPALHFDLRSELQHLQGYRDSEDTGPRGRTLVKEQDLRIVLMSLKSGGRFEAHQASGPVSIQTIEGHIRVRLPDGNVDLTVGQLLALEPNIRHDVEAIEDSAFLLTIGRTTYQNVSDKHESGRQ